MWQRLILILFFLVAPVSAWHEEGHVLVADIAWNRLGDGGKQEITELLRHHPDPDVRTLAAASVWPDQIRQANHPFHSYSRPDWHYQDRLFQAVPEGLSVDLGGQMLEQLARQTEIYQDPSRSKVERAVALCWVVHLVGDIHQPLHNSEFYDSRFPEGDQGGNQFMVVLGEQSLALHRLWDSAGGRFLAAVPPYRLVSYRRWFQDLHPPERFGEKLDVIDFEVWSDECLELARLAYEKVAFSEPVDNQALEWIMDTAEEQITLAGYRLGRLLERGFGG